MEAINAQPITADLIRDLFAAYNTATGYGVSFNVVWEREIYEAAKMGLTPEMFLLVVKDRLKGIQRGDRRPASVMPRNLIRGEDMISETICEGHALLALKRKVVDVAREGVLRASGRLGEPETVPARPAKAVLGKALDEMRAAVGQ